MIVVAQCCSWYGVLTNNYLANAIKNSIWAVAFLGGRIGLCRLLPEFDGPVSLGPRGHDAVGIADLVGLFADHRRPDVSQAMARPGLADGSRDMSPLEGLGDSALTLDRDAFCAGGGEIAWMSLYFTIAVWASLALCLVYSLVNHLPMVVP